jgi:hypothetical protein
MKVIFLDHDGVICLPNEWGGRGEKIRLFCVENNLEYSTSWNTSKVPMDVRMDDFDTEAIKVLNEILKETDAEIIISSDWKKHGTLEEIQEMYRVRGIIKSPIGVTPRLRDFDSESAGLFEWKGWLERARCLEIQKWLSDNSVDAWVVVDDLNMSNSYLNPGLDNFVLTPRSREGIKQSGVKDKIIEFLK